VLKATDIKRPVVVGFGPAGIFAALLLAKNGLKPIVIERGECVDERKESVDRFWNEGKLNPESNVSFGEGGAGTFSDGKLNTLVKDTFGRNKFVLEILVEYGAPKEILYDNKPHIGTDLLTGIVKSIREEIIRLGGEVRFDTKLIDIEDIDKDIEIDNNNTSISPSLSENLKNSGIRITDKQHQQLLDYVGLDGMNFEMLNRAIEITSEIHQPSFKYLKAILENWKKERFTSLEQVEEHEKKRQKPTGRTNTGNDRVVFQEYDDPLPF